MNIKKIPVSQRLEMLKTMVASDLSSPPKKKKCGCALAKKLGTVVWCRCIGNQVTPMGRG